ncbi:hypothetical protein BKA62DRAFT_60070 [Auriculariales sp. MPI-PUGE-AT-0066]|nr:hypothetical protein BKA62DRAFT_60070 [Auriculariales sp. MPI-PUGE-AT-0066]
MSDVPDAPSSRPGTADITALPTELLQQIFAATAEPPSTLWDEDISLTDAHDLELMLTPYRLASISASWRRLAFQTPELWTFITTAPWSGTDADITRIEVQLSRTAQMPLDIVLSALDRGQEEELITYPSIILIRRLCDLHYRWRRVRLQLVDGHGINWDFLSKPMPLLQAFVVLPQRGRLLIDESHVEEDFLSASHRIERLACHTTCIVPTKTWNNLEHLSINLRRQDNQPLWRTLHHTPNLRRLFIHFPFLYDVPHNNGVGPSEAVSLRKLEVLGIYGHVEAKFPQWVQKLCFPSLHSIAASSYGCYVLDKLFDRFSHQVRSLVIQREEGSRLSHNDAQAVLYLTAMEDLEIRTDYLHHSGADGRGSPILFQGFFEALTSRPGDDRPKLPKLRRVTLVSEVAQIWEQNMRSFVSFIAQRCAQARDVGETFDFAFHGETPDWFPNVAQRLRAGEDLTKGFDNPKEEQEEREQGEEKEEQDEEEEEEEEEHENQV